MALFQISFYSAVLGRNSSFNAVIPDRDAEKRKAYPVVYLLHGLSDDCTSWLRRSSVERYAEKYSTCVIMPDGGRSFYTDMKTGERYFEALSRELPEFVERMLPVSPRREDTFAAGLSMGGYGALKLALRFPGRFSAAGIMSAVTDIPGKVASETFDTQMWRNIFGSPEESVKDGNDLFTLAENFPADAPRPRIAQFCGGEDFLLEDNRRLAAALARLDWPGFIYREAPGTHSWEFWDRHIQDILNFFFNHGEEKNG